MGKHFGELAKIRGLITYKLSPHEQRAYAGAISNGLPNIFRRFRESVFRVAPRKLLETVAGAKALAETGILENPKSRVLSYQQKSTAAFIVGYLVYEGVEREHHRQSRKNPADYANDS